MVPPPEPKRKRMSSSEEELKDNFVDTVTKNTDDPEKKKKKKRRRKKNKASTRGKKSKAGSSKTKKFGSLLKDFLNSGILDGLHVKYSRGQRVRKSGDKLFRGVIKDYGIVCYCDDCNGDKVAMRPSEFELHVGSSKKHLCEFIFLENKNNLRHIMDTFLHNPLEKLEESVHKALGGFTMKKSKFCVNCRDVNVVSRLFCSSCEESKNCRPSPRHTSETSNSHVSPTTVNSRSPEPIAPQTSSYKGRKCNTSLDRSPRRLTRKNQCLHKLIFQESVLEDGTPVGYFVHEEKLLHGEININKSGILCGCCNEVVSPSMFEAHAGWASRRKPYMHIRTSNGVSLHKLAIERRNSMSGSDEANVQHKANVVASERISEGDPSEQITKRCTLLLKETEVYDSRCVLCSERDFNNDEFGPRTVMICEQCEKEYHVGCLKDHNMANLEELPENEWFCGVDCDDIYMKLQKLMARGETRLSDSLLSLIKKKQEEKGFEIELGLDVKWRVFNWKLKDSELLSNVVDIFHEQFDSIVDSGTRIDLIPTMVYGKEIKGIYSFEGMYCAVLIVNQVIVCSGIFRVFGQEVAELPLIATKAKYQGQGYFQSLLSCIENVLGLWKIKRLVLPAAHEAESMWTHKFGFTKPDQEEMNNFGRLYHNMMIFNGTSLLQKLVPPPLEGC